MEAEFVPLKTYGSVRLGAVTGANDFFALSETVRLTWGIDREDVVPIHPPGTRTLRGLDFGLPDWVRLRDAGERVWLLQPRTDASSPGLRRYLDYGAQLGIPERYKCQIRDPWWRPPLHSSPDLLFTYMSHTHPRLIRNSAGFSCLNSMHGVRLSSLDKKVARTGLPLLALNSLTLLGAELFGRSYGGGVLKMEPSEAASLPVPGPEIMSKVWDALGRRSAPLYRQARTALWTTVSALVDEALFTDAIGLNARELGVIREASVALRARRIQKN
jgi:hypothetical protein